MKPNRATVKRLCRFAQLIEQRYAKSSPPDGDMPFLSPETLIGLMDIRHRVNRSAELGLPLAKEQLLREYQGQLRRLESEIKRVEEQFNSSSQFVVDLPFVCRDLIALEHEYGQLHVDDQSLAVVTEPIVLDDVFLGTFKIELRIDSLAQSTRAKYAVIALDPSPAASNENLTHPHVDNERLCEGDAKHAIGLALGQGRLHDFFQLVEQVLKTYNRSSAYCSLEDWGDNLCSDCGSMTCHNDSLYCDKCESRVCDSCECQCTDCDASFCGGCCQICRECQTNICDSCVQQCVQCDQCFCTDCFSENERCTNCDEQTNENQENETEAGGTQASDPPVHADSLGQAVVSA